MGISQRLQPFGVTIFTEMTALALEHGAVNLGQGYPDWDGPDFVKEAAARSMAEGGSDQYPASAGIRPLREAVARRYGSRLGRELDPDGEVTITAGCTEALAASFLGLVDPGEEVVIVEPYYDAYPVGVALAGGRARYVALEPPDFRLDPDRLRAVFTERTRAIVVNTPHNPSGRVLTRSELGEVARLCVEYDAVAISDEVYEEMALDGEHIPLASLPGMAERTVTLSSLGKTYSLTGWKVGWAIAPPGLTAGVRAAHQYLTFTTPTPVQYGAVAALGAPAEFYQQLRAGYRERRRVLEKGLGEIGFDVYHPEGTYFLLAGYRRLAEEDDRTFARRLIEETKVATVPPSAFYHDPAGAPRSLRFAFCKQIEVLAEAIDRLGVLSRRG